MTNNEEFLVPVSIAKELKEIGFDKPCLFVLNPHNTLILSSEVHDKGIIDIRKIKPRSNGKLGEDFCSVPTYEQVFGWFRERGIHGEIVKIPKVNGWVYSVINDNKIVGGKGNVYEDVRLECLIKCLEELISFYREES